MESDTISTGSLHSFVPLSSSWLEMKGTKQSRGSGPPAVFSMHHNSPPHAAFTASHHVHITVVPSSKHQQLPHPFMSTSPPRGSLSTGLLLFDRLLSRRLRRLAFSVSLSPLCLYLKVHFSVMLLTLCQSQMSQAVTVCHGWCVVSEIITQVRKWIAACSRATSYSVPLSVSLHPLQTVHKVHGRIRQDSKMSLMQFAWSDLRFFFVSFVDAWRYFLTFDKKIDSVQM